MAKSVNHMCRADCHRFGGLRARARALFLAEWPGFLFLAEVVFCFGVFGYVHFQGCGGGGGCYGWWVFKRVS
jgi:hypothetical protein